MTPYADDGFGNLVPTDNPHCIDYGTSVVFAKVQGQLGRFEIATGDHEAAIAVVRSELIGYGDRRISRTRYAFGPVLALICNDTATEPQELEVA